MEVEHKLASIFVNSTDTTTERTGEEECKTGEPTMQYDEMDESFCTTCSENEIDGRRRW